MRVFMASALLASSVYAQSITTGRVGYTGNGTTVDAVVVNSGSAAYVVAGGSAPTPPILTKPHLVMYTSGDAVFANSLKNWTYPQNVTITGLAVTFHYKVSGWVYETIGVGVVYRNKITGITYEGPAPIVLEVGPYQAYYWVDATTQPSVASATFNFSDFGYPSFSSLDVQNGNIEIGFRVGPAVWSPFPPDTQAIKIFGVDIRGIFVPTSVAQTLPSAPVATYTPNGVWSNGTVTVSQTLPVPSSQRGAILYVRCANNAYYLVEALPWGMGANVSRSYPLYFLNTKCPTGAKLFQGGTTAISARPADGSTPFGNTSYSAQISLP
jgi:hypothetical protein